MSDPLPDPLEFMKKLWNPMGLPMPGMVAPTLDMNAVEKMGLLKIDFLGLITLDILDATLAGVKERTGTAIDLARGRVELAIEHQFARHVGDVIFRRSMLWLDAASARAAAPLVATWMGERLGWSEAERAAEVQQVLDELDQESALLREAGGG